MLDETGAGQLLADAMGLTDDDAKPTPGTEAWKVAGYQEELAKLRTLVRDMRDDKSACIKAHSDAIDRIREASSAQPDEPAVDAVRRIVAERDEAKAVAAALTVRVAEAERQRDQAQLGLNAILGDVGKLAETFGGAGMLPRDAIAFAAGQMRVRPTVADVERLRARVAELESTGAPSPYAHDMKLVSEAVSKTPGTAWDIGTILGQIDVLHERVAELEDRAYALEFERDILAQASGQATADVGRRIAEAVAAERQACVEITEDTGEESGEMMFDRGVRWNAKVTTAAIRARGTAPGKAE